MTLENSQNILLKINSIQDNIEYLNKPKNVLIRPILVDNSLINSSSNIYQDFSKNCNKDLTIDDKNLFQKNSTTQSSSNFNSLNKMNISLNSFDDSPFKKISDSLFNFDYLNAFHLNNRKAKLIHSKLDEESISHLNKEIIKNSSINLNSIKEKTKFRNRKTFNKFKISHLELKSNNRLRHKRKYKPDDIRKKIKARFHKSIKNIINENLRMAGSKHFFSFLPQIFISSIARDKNHQVLNLTYRELLQKDFISEIDEKKYKNKNVDLSKYKNNLRVLDYLDKNPEICKNSGFDIISKMKYSDLLEEYFKSDEFDKAIIKLQEENEEEDYINEYVNKAKTYVNFFSEVPFKIKKNKFLKVETEKIPETKNKILKIEK